MGPNIAEKWPARPVFLHGANTRSVEEKQNMCQVLVGTGEGECVNNASGGDQ